MSSLFSRIRVATNKLEPAVSNWSQQNQLEQTVTNWNQLEPTGTNWNQLEPVGTSWNQEHILTWVALFSGSGVYVQI